MTRVSLSGRKQGRPCLVGPLLPQGGAPDPILVTAFNELLPTFSPDGRWIAYQSNRSGRDEIYVRPYPGPGPGVTVSIGGGQHPVWSRDGSELFYRTSQHLMAVGVDLSDRFQAETPRALFEAYYEFGAGPNYDVSPDGEHFVMVEEGESAGESSLILITNWFTELKARMGN